jgi:upstream activation factor subunit UAF30
VGNKQDADVPSQSAKEVVMSKRRRNPRSSFWKPLQPGPRLAPVVGSKPVTRTQMVSKLWAYIKRHRLQSRSNPRMIKADAAMRELFRGKSSVNMFEMTRLAHRQLA